ncbi:hypothetical protein [Hahella sp. CCB-MM4]|uniref:hypothetical protein n=1 Tax=Hahella sp. (strain CCB-MM4) TaxID=1926491 RepID=UPI00143CF3FF|nr:hypothetical protein [Hahella sp. CCB-MM4]
MMLHGLNSVQLQANDGDLDVTGVLLPTWLWNNGAPDKGVATSVEASDANSLSARGQTF